MCYRRSDGSHPSCSQSISSTPLSLVLCYADERRWGNFPVRLRDASKLLLAAPFQLMGETIPAWQFCAMALKVCLSIATCMAFARTHWLPRLILCCLLWCVLVISDVVQHVGELNLIRCTCCANSAIVPLPAASRCCR